MLVLQCSNYHLASIFLQVRPFFLQVHPYILVLVLTIPTLSYTWFSGIWCNTPAAYCTQCRPLEQSRTQVSSCHRTGGVCSVSASLEEHRAENQESTCGRISEFVPFATKTGRERQREERGSIRNRYCLLNCLHQIYTRWYWLPHSSDRYLHVVIWPQWLPIALKISVCLCFCTCLSVCNMEAGVIIIMYCTSLQLRHHFNSSLSLNYCWERELQVTSQCSANWWMKTRSGLVVIPLTG